jgi:hypothetical protein
MKTLDNRRGGEPQEDEHSRSARQDPRSMRLEEYYAQGQGQVSRYSTLFPRRLSISPANLISLKLLQSLISMHCHFIF